MRVRRLDRELAALGHRIACVDGEVEQRAFQLVRIDRHAPQAAREHRLDRDVLADRAADQVGHAGDQPVDVGGLRIQRLAPREREQLLGQRDGALCAARHLIDRAPQFAVVGRSVAPDRFEIADDDGEQVVEVVRDAAGELADRLHLLRLPQLFLDQAALGEVASDLGEAHDRPVSL